MNLFESSAFVIWLAVVGCSSEARECTDELRTTPSGRIAWTDGTERVPDHVYVYYSGGAEPVECDIHLPSSTEALSYGCREGAAGPATLRVLLDEKHWDTSFEVTGDGCHATVRSLDLELDPLRGER